MFLYQPGKVAVAESPFLLPNDELADHSSFVVRIEAVLQFLLVDTENAEHSNFEIGFNDVQFFSPRNLTQFSSKIQEC